MSRLFDAMYEGGDPPWEIGRPQRFVAGLVASGLVRGRVLDVGCGTGENALFLAGQGYEVVALDGSRVAIQRAREKARARGVRLGFHQHDALELRGLPGVFDTVLDSALFHVFTDVARARYAQGLARVMRQGAELFLVCFSEREPDWGGPRRVSKKEIEATFGPPFAVASVEPVDYEVVPPRSTAKCHLARVVHVGRAPSGVN